MWCGLLYSLCSSNTDLSVQCVHFGGTHIYKKHFHLNRVKFYSVCIYFDVDSVQHSYIIRCLNLRVNFVVCEISFVIDSVFEVQYLHLSMRLDEQHVLNSLFYDFIRFILFWCDSSIDTESFYAKCSHCCPRHHKLAMCI